MMEDTELWATAVSAKRCSGDWKVRGMRGGMIGVGN